MQVSVPWAEEHGRFTLLMERFIIQVLLACQTTKGACAVVRIKWDQAWHVAQRAVARGMARKEAVVTPQVGVDEKAFRKPYVQATMEALPLAKEKIVFDRFHVMQHMTKAVDQVRKSENRKLSQESDERLKKTKYLWLTTEKNLSEKPAAQRPGQRLPLRRPRLDVGPDQLQRRRNQHLLLLRLRHTSAHLRDEIPQTHHPDSLGQIVCQRSEV